MYVPTRGGLGMHVEIRDPDDSMIISRVRTAYPYIDRMV